ncbi:ATP-binding protein [Endozoicomonas sp. OPT23]|uniref:ATP-binding protein n=1 Tax=Endozoicomonas sp. OPT23 TaxID=2072845 RepID=UPI00129BDB45|nr:ATP-binding protein [Endozoicomonas sp. OPT23]MRI34186.1 ATP-binding protein [Endozoicomonas sp. OPT23]
MSAMLSLEIDSELSNTTLMAMAVRGVCAMTTLSPVETNRLELCLVEIVNNAIEHAYENQAGQKVQVELELDDSLIRLTVSDHGKSIPQESLQPDAEPEVDPEQSDSWLCSGRGLHIVNKLMDAVSYQRIGDRNSFIMEKKLR